MSKSKKNIVDPVSMIDKYGSDAVRIFSLSDSPPEKDIEWSDTAFEGSRKFIEKLYKTYEDLTKCSSDIESNPTLQSFVHQVIKDVTTQLHLSEFNKAIARSRELFNYIQDSIHKKEYTGVKAAYSILIQLLNPYIPHITEEIWEKLGNDIYLANTPWPTYKEEYILSSNAKITLQINGKLKKVITLEKLLNNEELKNIATQELGKFIKNKSIEKYIVIENKLVNIVVK